MHDAPHGQPHWYVLFDGHQIGPISPKKFHDQLLAGRLRPDDLIWNDQLIDWQPAHAIFPVAFAKRDQVFLEKGSTNAQTTRVFDWAFLGPGRQPVLRPTQRKTGRDKPPALPCGMVPANLFLRLIAFLIDYFVFALSMISASMLDELIMKNILGAPGVLQWLIWVFIMVFCTPLSFFYFYNVRMTASPQKGTLGKILMGIGVVDQTTAGQVSTRQAAGRFMAKLLTVAVTYLVVVSFARRDRAALHDLMAKTYVVKMRRQPGVQA